LELSFNILMISHACTSISTPVVSWRADIDGTRAYNYALKNIKRQNNKQQTTNKAKTKCIKIISEY